MAYNCVKCSRQAADYSNYCDIHLYRIDHPLDEWMKLWKRAVICYIVRAFK